MHAVVVRNPSFVAFGCNLPVPVQQSVEGESDVHSDTEDGSSSSDDQLEVEVITDMDDFLFEFPDFV